MAEHQERPNYSSLVMNYLAFATLGLLCSLLFNSYYGTSGNDINQYRHLLSTLTQNTEYPLSELREVLQRTDCEEVIREAKVADSIKDYMTTKLRYQFDSVVEDASTIGHCHAIKVYGVMRHGTRYPTTKHLTKWVELQQHLPDRLPSDSVLRHWTNPLNQDVVTGRAEPTELTIGGMKEQYCLAKRLRQRFPEIVKRTYSPLTCALRSTQVSRTVQRGTCFSRWLSWQSTLSFAEGLFQETNPEMISIQSMKAQNDVYLRFDELPCTEYDNKVTHNKSQLNSWFDTFFATPAYEGVVQNVQQHFNPEHWKIGVDDVLTFYSICVHEMSILGKSSWCDLFGAEDLSVLEFYKDLKAYWIKGSGYPITGKRSVHLVHAILDYFTKGQQPLSLSFAHAETILPFLSFLKAFPVPTDLTPANYQELKSREFVTSRMVPYSGNVQLVLYDCTDERSDPAQSAQLYVRLLVNEEPREIGLCHSEEEEEWARSYSLCKLQVLRESAYNATRGFSPLTELCKGPS